MNAKHTFHFKVFVSFSIAFAFVVLALSGIVLYVAPPGRIANWSVWRFVALSKQQWQAAHTVFALLFVLAASFHLYFNWRVLLAYLKSKLHDGLRMKWELGTALSLGVMVLVATLIGLPPFATIMSVGEEAKNSWSTAASEPPVPHAELMTVAKLSDTVKVPTETAIANLAKRGIVVENATTTVKDIADRNGLTPQQVYQRIQSDDAKPKPGLVEGGGWGRKSVQDVCAQYDITVETGLERLKASGIDAEGKTPIRDLATARKVSPIEIAKLIAGQ